MSDNTGLIPDPTVTYSSADSTGTLKFTPVADHSGTATITVTVEDGGLDNNLATPGDNGVINRTIVVAVAPINDDPTGDVTITGTPTEDEILTADTSTLADEDGLGALSYQWSRDGSPIAVSYSQMKLRTKTIVLMSLVDV